MLRRHSTTIIVTVGPLVVLVGVLSCSKPAKDSAKSVPEACARSQQHVAEQAHAIWASEQAFFAIKGRFGTLDEIGFAQARRGPFFFSIEVIGRRYVGRGVRTERGPLQGDAWQFDEKGRLEHVVDRCSKEALDRMANDQVEAEGATPEPSPDDENRDKHLYATAAAIADRRGCCKRLTLDETCDRAVGTLLELATRPYNQKAYMVEKYEECPPARLRSLGIDLRQPMPAIRAIMSGKDTEKKAGVAAALAKHYDWGEPNPAELFPAIAPALEDRNPHTVACVARLIYRPRVRALMKTDGCQRARCESRIITQSQQVLTATDPLLPTLRIRALEFQKELGQCAKDKTCENRSGAVWALGEAAAQTNDAISGVVAYLAASGERSEYGARLTARNALLAMARENPTPIATALWAELAAQDDRRSRVMQTGDIHRIIDSNLVAVNALSVLARLPPSGESACPALFDEWLDQPENEAFRALVDAGSNCRALEPRLTEIFPRSEPWLRDQIATILGEMGAARALDALKTKERDETTLEFLTEARRGPGHATKLQHRGHNEYKRTEPYATKRMHFPPPSQ